MRTSRQGIALGLAVSIAATGFVSCTKLHVRMLLKKGNEFYTAQKYEQAIGEYQKILAIDPTNWDANYLTSVSYLALYHPGSEHPKDKEYAEKGLAAFEKTLELTAPSQEDHDKTEKYYLSFLDSAGESDKAIAYLEKQLEKRPNDVGLILQIASLYQKKGEFTKSIEYLEKRAKLDPNNKEAWYTLGVNCWARSYHGGMMVSQEERKEVVDRGIEALQKALAIDPNYFDALSYINLLYIEKAKVLAAEGKSDEATKAMAKSDEYRKRAIELKTGGAAKQKPS